MRDVKDTRLRQRVITPNPTPLTYKLLSYGTPEPLVLGLLWLVSVACH